jgi:glycogen operon protein
VSALRTAHPVFRRRRFFSGKPVGRRGGAGLPDIAWFAPDGSEMTEEDWESGFAKSIAVYLNGQGIPDLDVRGQRSPTTRSCCASTPTTSHRIHAAAKEFGPAWVPVIYTADTDARGAKPVTAGAKVPSSALR